jgi:PIN domain nuclease of toxin-antitoxin system
LDSHALPWFWEGNAALSPVARAAIEDLGNEKLMSHVTAWEVAIKVSLGKLILTLPYNDLFPGMLRAHGFGEVPTRLEHFRELLNVLFHHQDPFDRLLIAQARVEGLTLVSRDSRFREYGVPLLW